MPKTLKYEHGIIIAEGEFVMIRGRFSGNRQQAALIAVDSVHIEDSVLAEHWDVLQDEASTQTSASGLPMFDDRFPL